MYGAWPKELKLELLQAWEFEKSASFLIPLVLKQQGPSAAPEMTKKRARKEIPL